MQVSKHITSSEALARKKALYNHRKDNGLCTICGEGPPRPGRLTCQDCAGLGCPKQGVRAQDHLGLAEAAHLPALPDPEAMKGRRACRGLHRTPDRAAERPAEPLAARGCASGAASRGTGRTGPTARRAGAEATATGPTTDRRSRCPRQALQRSRRQLDDRRGQGYFPLGPAFTNSAVILYGPGSAVLEDHLEFLVASFCRLIDLEAFG